MNLRIYGKNPFPIALIHGGPGGAGGVASVAIELSKTFGVLEPLQTKDSIEGQIEELKEILEKNSQLPVTLIGHSWGAWLSYLFTAKYPSLVNKLILIGTPPFEEKYFDQIMKTRLSRFTKEEVDELNYLTKTIYNPDTKNKDEIFRKFGILAQKTDSYDPFNETNETNEIMSNFNIYEKVWNQAKELRKNNELLKMSTKIQCPIIAIHGDYDPHPAEGVNIPLSKILKDFKFILLEKCGHYPWLEKEAKDKFYSVLIKELKGI